jgi:hypothetical protein
MKRDWLQRHVATRCSILLCWKWIFVL